MSQFYDQASLVMVPSGYKNGKVYSQKPLSASGELSFTRASSATRVVLDASGQQRLEKVRTNQFNYSNTFNGAGWTLNDATLTSGQSGYDGTSNAWKLIEGSATAEHYVRQTPSVSGLLTISVYAKADTQDWLYFRGVTGGVNVRAWFDLQNGVVGTTNGSVLSRSIQSVGGGWYRCSMVWSHQSGFECYIGISNADGVTTYAGDGTSFILIQASQLETGDIATDYIATTSAAVSVGPVSGLPRLDYSGGATCCSLLLEPQRSNLFTFSESIDNAAWTKYGGQTITGNDAVSPDGYQNADKMVDAGGIFQQKAFSASTAYALSVFIKKDTATSFRLGFVDQAAGYQGGSISYTFATGAITITQSANSSVSGEAVDYGNGWIRLTCKFTTNAAQDYNYQFAEYDGGTGWAWGFQMEEGAYATSYIPTLSTAVTRVADACNKTGISSLIGQTEGTLFAEFYYDGNPIENWISSVQTSTTNFVAMFLLDDGRPYFYILNAGSPQMAYIGTALSVGYHKMAFGYAANNSVAYVDGVLKNTDTSCTIPATSEFRTGSVQAGNNQTAKIKQALLFKTRLSNADLATLTTL